MVVRLWGPGLGAFPHDRSYCVRGFHAVHTVTQAQLSLCWSTLHTKVIMSMGNGATRIYDNVAPAMVVPDHFFCDVSCSQKVALAFLTPYSRHFSVKTVYLSEAHLCTSIVAKQMQFVHPSKIKKYRLHLHLHGFPPSLRVAIGMRVTSILQ